MENLKLIREFISVNLEEDAHKRNTGQKFDHVQKLMSYVDDSQPPKYFFTMTKIPKVGVNPMSKYNTPIGIYTYPASTEFIGMLIDNSLPFVSDAPYVTILEALQPDKMLLPGAKGVAGKLSNEEIKPLLQQALKLMNFQLNSKAAIDWDWDNNKFRHFNPDAQFFGMMYVLTRKLPNAPVIWASIMRQLGFTSVYDNGYSVIHHHEPTQCVFLSPNSYRVVESFATTDLRKTSHSTADEQISRIVYDVIGGKISFEPYLVSYAIRNKFENIKSEILRRALFAGKFKENTWAADIVIYNNIINDYKYHLSFYDLDNASLIGLHQLKDHLVHNYKNRHTDDFYNWAITSESQNANEILSSMRSDRISYYVEIAKKLKREVNKKAEQIYSAYDLQSYDDIQF